MWSINVMISSILGSVSNFCGLVLTGQTVLYIQLTIPFLSWTVFSDIYRLFQTYFSIVGSLTVIVTLTHSRVECSPPVQIANSK